MVRHVFTYLFSTSGSPELLKVAVAPWTHHWTQLTLALDSCPSALFPGAQASSCPGGWPKPSLELYYKAKLSVLNGVWNHDLGPVLHCN